MAWGDLTAGQKFAGAGTGVGMLANGIFNSMNGGGRNPAGGAIKYLDQIPGQIKPYYDPYIEAGNRAMPGLEHSYDEMINDPNAIIKRLGAGYQKSPGYDWRLQQGEGAIGNAAAAGGMSGTPQHQQQAGQLAENMAGEDYDKYLDHVLGLFGGGVQGKQGISNQGYNASTSLADALAQILGTKAQYKYAGQAGENQAKSSDTGNIFGGLAGLASLFL